MAKDVSKKKSKSKKDKDKDGGAEERPFLGKLEKNHCRVGIVGLPNVGKSSFFNVLSTKQVNAENYPFCTIKPSQTQVAVYDKRFDHLCEAYEPKSKVPAVLEIWDIAGLVKGAHEGHGLGNAFLDNIRAVDAIYHVVRAFKDKHVEHVEGNVDPIRDMEIIASELRQKDLAEMTVEYNTHTFHTYTALCTTLCTCHVRACV